MNLQGYHYPTEACTQQVGQERQDTQRVGPENGSMIKYRC